MVNVRPAPRNIIHNLLEISIVLLLAAVLAGTEPTKYKLKAGIYSPPNTDWQISLKKARERMEEENLISSNIEIEFEFLNDNYTYKLRDVYQEIANKNSKFRNRFLNYLFNDTKPLYVVKNTLQSSPVYVLIGPYNHVMRLIAEDEGIPYIVTTWPEEEIVEYSDYTYFVLPHFEVVHSAVSDVAKHYQWQEVAVMYDSARGLHLIGRLMQLSELVVRAWIMPDGTSTDDLRTDLLQIRQLAIRNIIVICQEPGLGFILHEALRLSMLSYRYSWLIVNMNPHITDYVPYQLTQVNYTIFELFENHYNITQDLSQAELQEGLAFDALMIALSATNSFIENHVTGECQLFCDHTIRGHELGQYLPDVSLNGSTGYITFDEKHQRENVTLGVISLTMTGLRQIGVWKQGLPDVQDRLRVHPYYNNHTRDIMPHPLGHEVVKIVTIFDDPFVRYKPNHEELEGNDKFEGFLIDLMERIAKYQNFQYELYLSPDGNYGSANEDGEWNGMINELIVGNASMCLGAISITSERETVVDFAKPYKQKAFNLLMRKPKEKTSVFQFIWPLHPYVWALTMSAIILVGFLLYIMDRFSPNSANAALRFNLTESIWFIYGSLVGAGTEMVPRTISGRILSGAWWFFSLILISSYTANLAAFLTVTKIETPIKNIADLAAQNDIRYGTVKNTYANSFFRSSKVEMFKKMWTYMSQIHPDSMVDNSTVGLNKVLEGNYAFIWDSPINKFTTMFYCDTMVVGESFDEKGYGIGVPLGAAYRDQITMTILKFNEQGIIQEIEDKWWSGGKCKAFAETSTSRTKELNLHNVAGVFVVLAIGAVVGIIASIIEYFIRRARIRQRKKDEKAGNIIEKDGAAIPLRPEMFFNGQGASFFTAESML